MAALPAIATPLQEQTAKGDSIKQRQPERAGGGRARGAAGTSVPVTFDVSVRLIEGDLEVEVTTTVDQSRFGMSRGPLWNILQPAKLHVMARLALDQFA